MKELDFLVNIFLGRLLETLGAIDPMKKRAPRCSKIMNQLVYLELAFRFSYLQNTSFQFVTFYSIGTQSFSCMILCPSKRISGV